MSSFITETDFFTQKGRRTYTHFSRPSSMSKTTSCKKFEKIASFTSNSYIGKVRKNTELKKTFNPTVFNR